MKKVIVLIFCVVLAGCGDPMYGLRPHQRHDLRDWEAAGQPIVVEKSPQTATVLSLFIGLGSFYTDEPVLGVVDLLLWPFSPLWEIWISPAKANQMNYEATRQAWERRQRQEKQTP